MNLIIDKNLPDSVSIHKQALKKMVQTYLHPTAPIAAVKLQHVHAPVGEGLSVCLYVELWPRVFFTGFGSHVTVNS